jgi:RNA polymerase sigma-70 factor (ECF subfamily)
MGSDRMPTGSPAESLHGDQLFRRRGVVRDKDRDAALVADCLRGDRGAMGSLVSHYQKPVFNAAYRMLGNAQDAADVTQSVFLKAFENLEKFDPKFKFFSWIYRIAINESVSTLKRRRATEEFASQHAPVAADSAQALDDAALSRHVQAVLMDLSEEQRVLIVLKHFSELSYAEISAVMDIPEKTVKSRLYSARQKMKQALDAKGIRP